MPAPELEFTEWPKTYRVNRDVVVTEKIDGTNAAVRVVYGPAVDLLSNANDGDRFYEHVVVDLDGVKYLVGAQSRKKIITPEKDNFGFANFVFDNARNFVLALGEGVHFGEWYGTGIQRGYGLSEKRFMLFNTTRWGKPETREYLYGLFNGRVNVATVLYEGPFNTDRINTIVDVLRERGSAHEAHSFQPAEGVVVYHTQAHWNLKVTTESDEQPKGVSGA